MTLDEHIVYRPGEAIWERDPEYRARMEANPRKALAEQGMEFPESVEVRLVVNDADTLHFVFPPDPNEPLLDESLSTVSGGSGGVEASSAGSVSTVSSLGCIPSTASTGGSVSSFSSVLGPPS